MKRIKLSGKLGSGKYTLIDDNDFDLCSKFTWCCSSDGYVITNFGLRMHVLIMRPRRGLVVDHINHNKLDNRRENLRVCTTYENNQNRAKKHSRDIDLPDYIYRYYINGKIKGYRFRCDRDGVVRQKCGFKSVNDAVEYRDKLFSSLGFAN